MYDLSVLCLIWVSVFAAAYLADKTRLTPALWYLFFGAIMVNIGWLPIEMPVFIDDFAELGIIVIMFALGFEEDTGNFLKGVKRSWGIAFFGALVPFIIAYSASLYFWGEHNIALLCGLAMTATAVSLTMVSLKSEGLLKTPAATGIMTSAVLDDIASLALVAIMVPIATGTASLSVEGVLLILAKALLFFGIITFLGAVLFPKSEGWINKFPFVGRFSLSHLLAMSKIALTARNSVSPKTSGFSAPRSHPFHDPPMYANNGGNIANQIKNLKNTRYGEGSDTARSSNTAFGLNRTVNRKIERPIRGLVLLFLSFIY